MEGEGWVVQREVLHRRKDLQGLQVFKEGLSVEVNAMHELCKDSCGKVLQSKICAMTLQAARHSIHPKFYETICIMPEDLKQC